jgi:hypothetical protein
MLCGADDSFFPLMARKEWICKILIIIVRRVLGGVKRVGDQTRSLTSLRVDPSAICTARLPGAYRLFSACPRL